MELRPYQLDAVGAVMREWQTRRSTLLVMPTGTGKTQTFCEVLRRRVGEGHALVLAHRKELIGQAAGRLNECGFDARIEMGEYRAKSGPNWYGRPMVLVASIQSLRGSRLERHKAASDIRTIVIDEAHHAPAASYKRLLSEFPNAKVLGVTATPSKGMSSVFESLAYGYELDAAIRDGWLCDIVTKQVFCSEIDISNIKTKSGDLSDADIELAVGGDKALHQIAWPLVQEAKDRSTIVFTPTVATAHRLGEVLSGYVPSNEVGVIDAKTDKETRETTLRDFREGRKKIIVNCGILVEGVDLPRVACVGIARPTKNRNVYAQMVGRGTRLHDAKRDLLVLDFVGNSGRHKLVTPIDLLGGAVSETVLSRAKFIAGRGESVSALEAIKKAQEQLAKERAIKEARARAKAKVQVPVHYSMREVDLFGRQHETVSESMRGYLTRHGIACPPDMTHHQARQMAAMLSSKRRGEPATDKQANLLRRFGLRHDLSKVDASRAIDALAKNGWKASDTILAFWGHGTGKNIIGGDGQLPF